MSVRRLNPEVTAKLRSGVAINTVAQCVEELVLNSLDAGATCVAVRLDLTFFKVQVIDNGGGISHEDLELVGERYATSKCRTLEDVINTRTFGHRGEALASIGEISQKLTVESRAREHEVTYSKSIGGPFRVELGREQVRRANVQRPSSGTTVTVLNLLYNMPVRQASAQSVLDIEKVRRDLEILALGHSKVSFSLYDMSSNSWCMRVPRTLSTVKSFGHLFGGDWVPLLKSIAGSQEPFKVRGYVAVKGYHNRNLQFVFVDGRRIVDDKFQKTINEMFASFRQCPVKQPNAGTDNNRLSFLLSGDDLHPVYVLRLECPRDHYDIGLHPSKAVIEFRHFDVLKALIRDSIKRFLVVHAAGLRLDVEPEPSSNDVPMVVDGRPTTSAVRPDPEARVITVQDYGKSLHSLPAKRPYKPADKSEDEETESESQTDTGIQRVTSRVAKAGPSIPAVDRTPVKQLPSSSSCSSSSSSSARGVTLHSLYLSSTSSASSKKRQKKSCSSSSIRQDQAEIPISLSMAMAAQSPTGFGRFVKLNKEEQAKRTLEMINELNRRFMYKTCRSKGSKRSKDRANVLSSSRRTHKVDLPNSGAKNPSMDVLRQSLDEEPTSSDIVRTTMKFRDVDDSKKQQLDVTDDVQQEQVPTTSYKDVAGDTLTGQVCLADNQPIGGEVTSMSQKLVDVAEAEGSDVNILEGDRPDYLAASTAYSSVGRPEKLPEASANLTARTLLPLDVFPANDDTKLATLNLPRRPWNLKERGLLYIGGSFDEHQQSGALSVSKLFQHWRNPILCSASSSDCSVMAVKQWPSTKTNEQLAGTSTSVSNYAFSNTILNNIRVIGQADCKFIVCIVHYSDIPELESASASFSEPNLVVLFDQHAVHERIRLEQALKEAGYNDAGDGSEQPPTVLSVDPPLKVCLSQEVVRVSLQKRAQLAQFIGVEVSPANDENEEDEGEIRGKTLLVHSLPACLLEREASECKQKRPSVLKGLAQELIQEVVDDLIVNRAIRARMPKVVLDVLKSQACHGAIKFGHRLDIATCKDLMVQLQKCLLPFQCAHGRQSVATLVDLHRIPRTKQIDVAKPNLGKLMKMMADKSGGTSGEDSFSSFNLTYLQNFQEI